MGNITFKSLHLSETQVHCSYLKFKVDFHKTYTPFGDDFDDEDLGIVGDLGLLLNPTG